MKRERNPVGWFELYVSDMPRAKAFYETVFQTILDQLPAPDVEMWAFPHEPERPGCAGALAKMEGKDPGNGGTIIYFSCEDCASEESRVNAAGGSVHLPKTSIGEYGFISLVLDSEGNMIGLHSMT
jgi:predicted enzyme related to lactoylglutathione lyase